MLKILETQGQGNLVATVAIDKLTREDYDRLIPFLEKKIEESGKLRWYFEMEDFNGWEIGALWQDFKFDVKHANDFERVAMVGDKSWQEWMSDLMKPFTSAEVRFFELRDQDKAHEWIQQKP